MEFNYLWLKYKNMSPMVKAGFWFTICNVLQRGIQFLTTPIYTRLLTISEYGMYSIFITWMNIITVFASLNLSSGVYYNGILKFEDDQKRYTSSVQTLGTMATCIVLVLFSVLYPIIGNTIGLPYSVAILMFAVILVNPAFQFWSVQQRLNYKYIGLIIATLINSLLAPLVGIASIVFLDAGYKGVIWGYVIGNVIVSGIFYIRNILVGRTFVDLNYWKYSAKFSIPLIPHYLSQIALGQADRVMINYFCGSAIAGIYTLAYQVALIMNLLISGINNALTPWLYQSLKDQKYSAIKKHTFQLIIILAVITVGMMIIAPELISILGTKEYMQAKWVIPPVMLSTCITFIYCIYGTVLFYFEETKKVAFASSTGAVLNVVLNYTMIPRFGFIAAAYTTVVGYGVMYLFYLYYTRKVCRSKNIQVSDLFELKKIILTLLVLISFSFIMTAIYNLDSWIRYVTVVIAVVLAIINKNKIIEIVKSIRK